MTDKLSYDIIGLVALIDRVKRAANRYIRNENQIANTMILSTEHDSNIGINDINERVSEQGLVPSDNNPPIIASGRSGFETLTDLVTQNGFGNLTNHATSARGTSVINDNITGFLLNIDYCITNPPLVFKPSDHCAPIFIHYDSLTATTYFNDTSAVGGIIPTDMRETRLAIESDIHLSIFLSVSSCLSDFQFVPNDVYNGFRSHS